MVRGSGGDTGPLWAKVPGIQVPWRWTLDATASDGRRIPGHRFGGFCGWPGEAGFGLGVQGRSFGGAPWPGFVGCPGLEAPLLGSDMNFSEGPRQRDPGAACNTRQDLFQAPVPGV
jgi:hypothetical protein